MPVAVIHAGFPRGIIPKGVEHAARSFRLGARETAAAIMLAVELPLAAEAHRGEPTVMLFEVRGEITHAEALRRAYSDGVDEGSVLSRAHGESGGKGVVFPAVRRQELRRFPEPQREALRAPSSPFGQIFFACRDGKELRRILLGHYEFDIGKVQKKAFKRVKALDELLFRQNVGVVIKECDIEMRRDAGEHSRRARTAADVQKQAEFLSALFLSRDLAVDVAPEMSLFHASIIPLCRSFANRFCPLTDRFAVRLPVWHRGRRRRFSPPFVRDAFACSVRDAFASFFYQKGRGKVWVELRARVWYHISV